MRPGKPFMYGRKCKQHVLGLPGNPVSALVCARLFLKPLLDCLQGMPMDEKATMALLGIAIPANDSRQDYIRARLEVAIDGSRTASSYGKQDSSMQRTFRDAHCLIVRPPNAPAASIGDLVPILNLDF
jgi:molybdopterin molybdotransferase